MSGTSRRKLLKSIAAGSGAIVTGKSLPESWSKPVVDSVLLPVHAQTSGLRSYFGGAMVVAFNLNNDLILARVTGNFINDAHANPPAEGSNGTICAEELADGVDVQFQNKKNTVLRRGVLPKTGEGTLAIIAESPDNGCDQGQDLNARITDITNDYLELEIYHDGEDAWVTYRVVPSASCNMPQLSGVCR